MRNFFVELFTYNNFQVRVLFIAKFIAQMWIGFLITNFRQRCFILLMVWS